MISCNAEGVGGVGPAEWASGFVVVGDERDELGGQIVAAVEVAVPDDFALQDREEQFD